MTNKDKRKSHKILLLIVSLMMVTGCWDQREVEERTNVLAIGVDKSEDGENLLVSLQIPIPLNIEGGSGGSGGKPIQVISAEGKTFFEAIEKIQYKVDQQIAFGQTRLVAFSKEVAEEGLRDILDVLRRDPQIRRLLLPIVLQEGKAIDLMNVSLDLEKVPSIFLRQMIRNSIRLGNIPKLTLGQFFIGLSNTAKQPSMISVITSEKEPVSITGVAAFKDSKLVGFLDTKQTNSLLRIKGENNGGELTFQVDEAKEHSATFSPEGLRVNYEFSYEEGKVGVDIDISIEGEITEMTYPLDVTKIKNLEQLQEQLEKVFEKRAVRMLNKLQKEYNTDITNIGSELRAYDHDIWEKVDWQKAFPEAEIKVNYKVMIRRTGMQMKPEKR